MTWQVGVITLFPEMFTGLQYGIVGRAMKEHLAAVQYWNPRDFSLRADRRIDDKPYGGGPGMIMQYEPLQAAILNAKEQLPEGSITVFLSPQGQEIKQQRLNQIAQDKQSLLFVAGRYEGIDERIIENDVDEEWSIGNFVLSGGELAAMVIIDAIVRLLPGSLGHYDSAQQDSFMNGLLDCPHYTRPEIINNKAVPTVLLKGNHREIQRWRRKMALGNTWRKRPELLHSMELSELDKQLLTEFKNEYEEE